MELFPIVRGASETADSMHSTVQPHQMPSISSLFPSTSFMEVTHSSNVGLPIKMGNRFSQLLS